VLGVSKSTVNRWGRRGGCPRNDDKSYHLPTVVQWRIELLSGNDGAMLGEGGESPAREELLRVKTEREKLALKRDRGELLPREELREGFRVIAERIRNAGETLQRQWGEDARLVLDEAIDDAERALLQLVVKPEHVD